MACSSRSDIDLLAAPVYGHLPRVVEFAYRHLSAFQLRSTLFAQGIKEHARHGHHPAMFDFPSASSCVCCGIYSRLLLNAAFLPPPSDFQRFPPVCVRESDDFNSTFIIFSNAHDGFKLSVPVSGTSTHSVGGALISINDGSFYALSYSHYRESSVNWICMAIVSFSSASILQIALSWVTYLQLVM